MVCHVTLQNRNSSQTQLPISLSCLRMYLNVLSRCIMVKLLENLICSSVYHLGGNIDVTKNNIIIHNSCMMCIRTRPICYC